MPNKHQHTKHGLQQNYHINMAIAQRDSEHQLSLIGAHHHDKRNFLLIQTNMSLKQNLCRVNYAKITSPTHQHAHYNFMRETTYHDTQN